MQPTLLMYLMSYIDGDGDDDDDFSLRKDLLHVFLYDCHGRPNTTFKIKKL